MPGAAVIPGVVASARKMQKIVKFPGMGLRYPYVYIPANNINFNTVIKDDWFPQRGIEDGKQFQVPTSGVYTVRVDVDWPSGGAVGWTSGYSGAGGADTWIRVRRGGGIILDNVGRVSIGLPDDPNHHYVTVGPTDVTLQAGDTIEVMGDAGATGNGPIPWDALLTMLRK